MTMEPKWPERNRGLVRCFSSKSSTGNCWETIEEKRRKIRETLARERGEPLAVTWENIREPQDARETHPVVQEMEKTIVHVNDEDVEIPPERCDREYMLQRFFWFIREMIVFLPEWEWVTIGNKFVKIWRTEERLSITLRDNLIDAIYKYRLISNVSGGNDFQYAQYAEVTRGSDKELTYSFTQKEDTIASVEFSCGEDVEIIEIPGDLLWKINRFENTVRGLLWRKNSPTESKS